LIAPGIVNACLAEKQMETEAQYARRIKNDIPLGEPQRAEQVTRVTALLCSETSDYMAGSTLLVGCGCSLLQFDG
jgi:enoyl-[acyl-carrier-protein] reductase (NADH)